MCLPRPGHGLSYPPFWPAGMRKLTGNWESTSGMWALPCPHLLYVAWNEFPLPHLSLFLWVMLPYYVVVSMNVILCILPQLLVLPIPASLWINKPTLGTCRNWTPQDLILPMRLPGLFASDLMDWQKHWPLSACLYSSFLWKERVE